MSILITLYIFLLGVTFGSFFNVVALRVPAKRSIVRPPSQCSTCSTRLKVPDLIPVFSYLFSKGQCRYCGSKVSLLYPLGELATGLLFLGIYLRFGWTWEAAAGLLLVSLSVIISISDLTYKLIPNSILVVFLALLVPLLVIFPIHPLWSHLLGAVLGGGILLLIGILFPRGMGMGDVKLFFIFGWVAGFPNVLLALMLACLFGSVTGGLLLILKIVKREQPIPFGPFLALGTLISYSYGTSIVNGYLSIIAGGM